MDSLTNDMGSSDLINRVGEKWQTRAGARLADRQEPQQKRAYSRDERRKSKMGVLVYWLDIV